MSQPPPGIPPWQSFEDPFPYSEVAMQGAKHSALLHNILSVASQTLLQRARELAKGGDTERQLAVIFSQSACEMHTEKALDDLMRKGAPSLNEAVLSLMGSSISLDDGRVRKVYGALTKDYPWVNPGGASWWEDWRASRELRHDMTHEGKPATSGQAERAVRAAEEYMAHISQIVRQVILKST
jgi:hypothetical protein